MDPFAPPPPQPAYFDPGLGAFVLSRYADVLAALHEPALRQEQGPGKNSNSRGQVLSALQASHASRWQQTMCRLAEQALAEVSTGGTVDLVRQLIRPWAAGIATFAVQGSPAQKRRLQRLARDRARPPGRVALRTRLANAELDFFFRGRQPEKSVFIGISETLPAFLANAWAALLSHPAELVRLQSQPELLPSATEELLRYAGLVHSLIRRATFTVEVAGVHISAGDRVILKLASANRDPEQFTEPDRLDLSRRTARHLGLGHGDHSCAGAMMVRPAFEALTRVLLERFPKTRIGGNIEWRWGDMLVSAATLPAMLNSH